MSGWKNHERRSHYVYPTTYVPAPMTPNVESRYIAEFAAPAGNYFEAQAYIDPDSYYGPPGYTHPTPPRRPPPRVSDSPISDDTPITESYPFGQDDQYIYPSHLEPTGRQPARNPPKNQIYVNLDDIHDHYWAFSNSSDHPVKYLGKDYPTAEHLFQSFKFHGVTPKLAEWVRTCSDDPGQAVREALHHTAFQRPDWAQIQVRKMYHVLEIKFRQNEELKDILLTTGEADIKVMGHDPGEMFWGIGGSGKGANHLGACLQELRTSFRY